MGYLILVRHGESRWNKENRFTGWVDIPLNKTGIEQATKTGRQLKNTKIDIAFTSKLIRAHETLLRILAEQKCTGIFLHKSKWRKSWSMHLNKLFDKTEIPIHSSDKLNERYYGKLQGMNKEEVKEHHGEELFTFWRRGWNIRPPGGESLKDVYKRVVPYFKKRILPHLRANQNVLVSAHGNSLRALVKFLDQITDEDIPHLEITLGKPLIYEFKNNTLIRKGVEHKFLQKPEDETKTKVTKNKTKTTTKKKKAVKKQTRKTKNKKIEKKPINKRKTASRKTTKRKVTKPKRKTTTKKKSVKNKVTKKRK